MNEFELIERFFTHIHHASGVVLGVGDDGAVLDVPVGEQLVAVMDTQVAGRHFPLDTSPFDIGWRALATNLSDLAAMGATPRWFTLALTLPEADEAWLAGFAEGLSVLAAQAGVSLVGGDTTRGPLTITIQAEGTVPAGQALRRSGARPGDGIYVSGYPGDAAAGLALHQGRLARATGSDSLLARFFRPEPRLALGLALRGKASACIDVSDGLLQDLGHILAASGVGAVLDLEALPVSAALVAIAGEDARSWLLSGGDDYELCFTAPDAVLLPDTGLPLTRIGTVQAGAGLYDSAGNALEVAGYQHFGGAG